MVTQTLYHHLTAASEQYVAMTVKTVVKGGHELNNYQKEVGSLGFPYL